MEPPQNPFAPPSASLEAPSGEGVWRDGAILVATSGSVLPPRCVKCGEPAAQMKKRTYFWHHPALYLLVLCAMLLYLLVAIIARRRATLTVGLCPVHAGKRRNGLLVGWLGAAAGIAIAIAGMANDACGLGLAGMGLSLGAIIAGMLMARMLYPQRIDKTYARLKGCGEGFLAALPEFSG